MDDQTAQAGAALARRADGREGDAAHRQLEVGARRDDGRVVAAELEDQAAEAAGDDRSDGPAHARRSGGRHDGHRLVGRQRGTDVGSAVHDLGQAVGRADVGRRPPGQRVAGEGGQRRLVRRLPDHRIAGDQRQGGVPRPHGDREVERRDDGARTHRVPRLHQPVAGPLAGDGQAVQLARQPDGEVADVDHLLDLAEALGADLAGLDRHQLAELGLVLAQQLAEPADEVAADRAPASRATRRRRRPHGRRRRRRRPASPAGPSDPPVIGVRASSRSPSAVGDAERGEEASILFARSLVDGQRHGGLSQRSAAHRRGSTAPRRLAPASRRAAGRAGSTDRRTSARAGLARSRLARGRPAVSWSGRSKPIIRPRPRHLTEQRRRERPHAGQQMARRRRRRWRRGRSRRARAWPARRRRRPGCRRTSTRGRPAPNP